MRENGARAWLERQPPAPEPLRRALLAALADADARSVQGPALSSAASAGTGEIVEELTRAAGACLMRAMAATGSGMEPASAAEAGEGALRPGAAELLLADALATYALAAAAEAGVPMQEVLSAVQREALQQAGETA